jgi:hypothetical protein
MNRPIGVIILAVLQAIGSIFLLLAALGALVLRETFTESLATTPEAQDLPPGLLEGAATFVGILLLVLSIIGFVLAWGLVMLQAWAWLITLILQGLSIAANLFGVVSGTNPGGGILQIVISGVIIYYLLRPNVKRAFGRPIA